MWWLVLRLYSVICVVGVGWTDGRTDFFVELFGAKNRGTHRPIRTFWALIVVYIFFPHATVVVVVAVVVAVATDIALLIVVSWREVLSISLVKI